MSRDIGLTMGRMIRRPPLDFWKRHAPSLACLAAVLALAAALRCSTLGESLWLDELHTSWVAAESAAEIAPRAALGNQSPLYFYLPWLSAAASGQQSELALRLPSWIAGMLTIPLLYAVIIHWTGKPVAGLAVALLAAVDADFIWFAQEARVYALVQLLATAHLAICWRLIRRPTRGWRAAAVAVGVVLFYLHYTTALLFAAELAAYGVLVIGRRERPRYSLLQAGTDLAIAVLACSPSLPHLAAIARAGENWRAVVGAGSLAETLASFPWIPLAVGAAVVAMARLARPQRTKIPQEHKTAAKQVRLGLFLCVVFIGAIALAWASGIWGDAPLLMKRYVIAVSVAPPLAAGLLSAASESRAWRVAICLVVAAAAVFANPQLHFWSPERPKVIHSREDWRSATAIVRAVDPQGRFPVLLRPGFIEGDARCRSAVALEREYCLAPIRGVYRLTPNHRATPLATTPGPADRVVRRAIAGREAFWLITRSPSASARRQAALLLTGLESGGERWRVVSVNDCGGVSVVLLASRTARRTANAEASG